MKLSVTKYETGTLKKTAAFAKSLIVHAMVLLYFWLSVGWLMPSPLAKSDCLTFERLFNQNMLSVTHLLQLVRKVHICVIAGALIDVCFLVHVLILPYFYCFVQYCAIVLVCIIKHQQNQTMMS